MVSLKFKIAVELAGRPAWKIAQQADLHPATLSKFLSDAEKVKPDNERVIRVGNLLGLSPADCFEAIGPEQFAEPHFQGGGQ